MLVSYNALTEEGKAIVGEIRYRKLQEAIALAQKLADTKDAAVVVKDQSANGYDMDISGVSTADLAEKDGEIALKGYADVTGETADETFNSLIGGNKAFTIEAVFNPNNVGYNGSDYNMIASKGDSSAAFRVSEQTVYFFIKNTNGSWKIVQVPLTSEEMNQWLHVAAVYDGNNISVYVEGKEMVTTQNVGSVATTTYPLGIGYCPETQRLSSGYLKNIRVYSAALSKDDLDNGTYKADNEKTVLWYDFDEYKYNNIDTKATGVNVSTDALELKEEEVVHLNNYCVETSKVTGMDYTPLKKTAGVHHLNGVQTVAYARIRYTAGNDFRRAARQREVIYKIVEKAKNADVATLSKILDKVFPNIYTSFSKAEILQMGMSMLSYDIEDQTGFPFDHLYGQRVKDAVGIDVVLPVTLESNVIKLHEFLYPEDSYTPSEEVKAYSQRIVDKSGFGEESRLDHSEDGSLAAYRESDTE